MAAPRKDTVALAISALAAAVAIACAVRDSVTVRLAEPVTVSRAVALDAD